MVTSVEPTTSHGAGDISRLPLPPGSSGPPLLGQTFEFLQSPRGFVRDQRRKHGDIFRAHVLGGPTVFMIGPEANRWIFAGENKYLQNQWTYGVRKLIGASAVSLLAGEPHKERRNLLAPFYTRAAVRDFIPTIESLAASHMDRWAQKGGVITVVDELRALVFEIAVRFIIGDDELDCERLSRLFQTWTAGLFTALPVNLPFTLFGRAVRAGEEMRKLIEAIVVAREQRPDPQGGVLGALLAARDERGERLPRKTIVEELQVELFAGHDTTLTATANLMFLLAQHPAVLARAREEQRNAPQELSLDSLKAMPYLHQVVNEGLRFIPPVGGAFRIATTDVSFGGYRIPKGWRVALSCIGTHDSSPWTDPDRFDPERFSAERGENKKETCAFIPFGGGPRVCLGQHFAMVEMVVMMAILLRHYRWELVPGQDLTMTSMPFPLPKSRIRVRFSRLSPKAV